MKINHEGHEEHEEFVVPLRLANRAEATLQRLGYKNVQLKWRRLQRVERIIPFSEVGRLLRRAMLILAPKRSV